MGPERTAFLRDIVAAVILAAVGLAGILETLAFPARAAAWPMAMWGALIFFSLVLLLGAVRGYLGSRKR